MIITVQIVYFFKWLNEDDLHVYNEKLTVALQILLPPLIILIKWPETINCLRPFNVYALNISI